MIENYLVKKKNIATIVYWYSLDNINQVIHPSLYKINYMLKLYVCFQFKIMKMH